MSEHNKKCQLHKAQHDIFKSLVLFDQFQPKPNHGQFKSVQQILKLETDHHFITTWLMDQCFRSEWYRVTLIVSSNIRRGWHDNVTAQAPFRQMDSQKN